MKKRLLAALMVAVAVSPDLASAACEEPSALLSRAKGIQQPSERAAMLGNIIPACRDFALANALGESLFMAGDYNKAKAAFMEALDSSKTEEQRAEVLSNLGVISQQSGKTGDALRYYRASLKRKADQELEQHLLALERAAGSNTVTADTIAAELNPATITTKSIGKNFKGFSVCPAIDLRVEFDFNSYRLKPEGVKQTNEIAAAMKKDGFNDMSFKIIGHTDLKGSDQANDKLSLKRAEALKEYLVKNGGISTARLFAEGKGKRAPMFSDPKEQARNRRVEIQLVSASGGDKCN